ncbi:MAG: hypothetical protein QF570_21370 [Myxococcota bacterium]|nr:hypothetical protein [Myxococcota bacterium]
MPFVLSALIACVVFALLGSAVLRRSPLAMPFTSILFGQMLAWCAAVFVLPIGAGLQQVVGASPPIGAWLLVGTAIAAYSGRAHLARFEGVRDGAGLLLGVVGLAAIVKVALVYSSDSHIGALGLDTHQHIFWTRQLLDAHHVPLTERGTDILALYPRGFHLLTALWSAAGIAGPLGSWVKLMPFLQAWLACVAFAEVVCAGGRRHAAAALLAIVLVVYAFAMSRMVFPDYDLNGTPRFASTAVLFFPWLALIAGRQLADARLGKLALASTPAVFALLLSMNAVVAVQAVVFVMPLIGVALSIDRETRHWPPLAWVAVSLAIAIAVVLQDPWIIAQWAKHLAPGYLALFGVITPEHAASLGLLSQDELVSETGGAVAYASAGSLVRLFAGSLWTGVTGAFTAGWFFPFQQDLLSGIGRIALRLAVLVCAALAFASPATRNAPLRPLFFAVVAGMCVGGFAQQALVYFADGLSVGRDYAFVLLRNYSGAAAGHVGLPIGAMALVTGIAWATTGGQTTERGGRIGVGVAAAVACALPFVLYGTTETVDPEHGFWAPLRSEDIEHLRTLEQHIEPEEGVLVPSAAWGIGEERWIVPQGATASVLPFSERRLVFNARLGTSVYYNWRDVAEFCDGSDAERADFLARHDVRWFLLRDERAANGERPSRAPMCKLPMSRLGVVTPAVAVAGDLVLYRIDPARLRGAGG